MSSEGSKENAGRVLERRVGRVEFAQGAFVRVRVPVRDDSEPGRDILTDIDVLSVDVDFRLRLTRSMLECKSGKGQAGEPDRLFWLKGFQTLVGAERAVLVRTSTSERAVALARALDLHVLDAETLGALEGSNAWLPARFAHIDGGECLAAESRTDTQLKAFREMPPSLVAFLRFDALLADPFRILGALVTLRAAIGAMNVVPEPAGTVLAGHALVDFLLAAVSHASQAETVSKRQLERQLRVALTTGNPHDEHVLDVLQQADDLFSHRVNKVHDAYVSAGAAKIDLAFPSVRSLVEQPAEWVGRYLDLVDRLRANSSTARDLLQTAELACFDALVGGDAWTSSSFDHLFTPEHKNLLMNAIKAIQEVIGGELTQRLEQIDQLGFDRTRPAIPDRTRSERREPTEASSPLAHPPTP